MQNGTAKPPVSGKQGGQKRLDLITGIVLIALSVFIIFNAIDMQIYTQYAPGPGFFPLWIGIILGVLSLGILWQGVNPKKEDKKTSFDNPKGTIAAVKLIVGLAGYALVLKSLGYIIATFLLVLYVMLFVTKDKPKVAILEAVFVTVMIVLIFQVGLQLRLPMGILKF